MFKRKTDEEKLAKIIDLKKKKSTLERFLSRVNDRIDWEKRNREKAVNNLINLYHKERKAKDDSELSEIHQSIETFVMMKTSAERNISDYCQHRSEILSNLRKVDFELKMLTYKKSLVERLFGRGCLLAGDK